MRDLVIVGAGPAGIAAALWARAFELDALLLERAARVGGQLHRIHFEPPQLVSASGSTGPELAAVAERRLAERGVEFQTGTIVESVLERVPGVRLSGGGAVEACAVIVATGLRPRKLGVPGEERLLGAGLSYSATRDLDRLAGTRVMVIGGGDAAYENALILVRAGCAVTLAVRDAPAARPAFQTRVAAESAIEILPGVHVVEVRGERRVESVVLAREDGTRFDRPCDGAVIKVGNLPNTEWCEGALDRDAEGYVRVDAEGRTSRPGFWAAGDVTRPGLEAIPVAEAQGASVVRAILRELGHG